MKKIIKKIAKVFGFRISRDDGKIFDLWPFSSLTPATIYEADKKFHQEYNQLMNKIDMMKTDNPLRRNRHYFLKNVLRIAPLNQANISECGCWKGLSAYIISSELKKNNFKNKFYIFDSFEGLSEFRKEDKKINFDQNKANNIRKHFTGNLELVKKNLSIFNDFLIFHKGWVPTKFKEVDNKNFSFVHIDLDLYQPTLDSLNFFGPRMIKNGIILLDDYGSTHFPGAELATRKFLENSKEFLLLPLSFGSAILTKKNYND